MAVPKTAGEGNRGLRSPEVADRLGVSIRTLEHWRRCGFGPPFHRLGVGKRRLVVYFEDELAIWIKDSSSPSALSAAQPSPVKSLAPDIEG